MANTRAKKTGNANTNTASPKDQDTGMGKGRGAQKDTSLVQQGDTHMISEQPIPSPKAATEQPARKGRGRPKKTVAMEEDKSVEDIPQKRTRKDTGQTSNTTDQPPAKRTKEVDSTDNIPDTNTLPQRQQKAENSTRVAAPAPRDPLPDRAARNVHPVPKKAARRGAKEVEADRKAKLKAIEDRIQEMEEAKRRLVEANTIEDIDDDAMDEGNPQRLSAAIQKCGNRDTVDHDLSDADDGEVFDFREVDAMSDGSNSDSEETETPVQIVSIEVLSVQKLWTLTNEWWSSLLRKKERRWKGQYAKKYKTW